MSRTQFFTVAVLCGMVFAAQAAAAAESRSTGITPQAQPVQPPIPAAEHKMIASFVDSGNPQSQLSAGANVIEIGTVTCPKSESSCTLILSAMDQVAFPASATQWAIQMLVDGAYADSSPVQDILPANGIDVGSWMGDYPVAPGKHTITFQTYVEVPALQAQWSVNYTVAKP
ncbi:MAG TPA: hypothetical protein VHY79_11945 [Rhizomicrobium sp.]|nr:hypothetical protein [Rhizomicrobium sp.]